MQRSNVMLCLTLFVLCWTLSCFDSVEADGIVEPAKTSKVLRKPQQKKILQSEETQLDEPGADMEGKNDTPSGNKSPEEILAGKH